MEIRKFISSITRHLTYFAINGPLLKGAALVLENLDDRRRVTTTRGLFFMRVGNSLERWRTDTLATKEPETIKWLNATISADSVFYDVGSNIGLYSMYALHLFPNQTQAVCFEPEALNFARLNQNINDNGFSEQATPFAIGLGETENVIQFRLSRLQAGRALHGERHVAEGDHDHRQGLVIFPLDKFVFGDYGLPQPTHLKIDVDGPELDILHGAKRTLSLASLCHVLVEIEGEERDEANSILINAGFTFIEEGASTGGVRNIIYEKTCMK
jgi:FkbM family methyltransferase